MKCVWSVVLAVSVRTIFPLFVLLHNSELNKYMYLLSLLALEIDEVL